MGRIKGVLLALFIFFLGINCYALQLETNSVYNMRSKSGDVDLYVNTEEEIKSVSFSFSYSSYDVPSQFKVYKDFEDDMDGALKHTVTFDQPQKGKTKIGVVHYEIVASPKVTVGTVNINDVTAKTKKGKTIQLDSVELKIEVVDYNTYQERQEQNKPTYNLLDKIESSIIKVNIVDDVFEYDVLVPDDIEELDLVAIPKEENYTVKISNQKLSEIKDNKITIKVKGNDKEIQNYVLNIKLVETKRIEIDNSTFEKDDSYKSKFLIGIVGASIALVIGLVFFRKKQ